jgi:hypothetical protein
MSKRKETTQIEDALHDMCKKKRIYGCEEVTIGFYNNGHGNEIADFTTIDSRGTVCCYEIKVSVSDLKSKAKKSWYGNYNYLVVTDELYKKVNDWSTYTSNYIGLIVGYFVNNKAELASVLRAKKRELSNDDEIMIKESMIRSFYWKMKKYKDASDIDKVKRIQKESREWEKKYTREKRETSELQFAVQRYRRKTGINISELYKYDETS